MRVNLYNLKIGNGFFDMTPITNVKRKKIDNLGCITIKNFCASKDTIKKVKRLSIHRIGKIFTKHIFDMGTCA